MKKAIQPTLADSICDLRSRKIKTVFFDQINTILDWKKTSSIIDKHYEKGKRYKEIIALMNMKENYYYKVITAGSFTSENMIKSVIRDIKLRYK